MEIRIINNQNQWDGWLAQNVGAPFTQSWAWGDILIAEGKIVERLAIVENGEVLAQAQIVYSPLFFDWQYAFCPHGPVVSELGIKNYELRIYETIINYLQKKNIIFFRIEPEIMLQISDLRLQKTIDINPSATLMLDIKKSEEELLTGMQQKTRYNIHLAEKKNLSISQEKNLAVFWNLMNKTGSRDKFGLHHKSHYEAVLKSAMVYQLTAYESDKAVACAVFANFAGTFTYLYGASDYEYRNLMAPYLLQWAGIKMGKSFGCERYDFFGIAPPLLSKEGLGGGLPSIATSTPATPSTLPLGKGEMMGGQIENRYMYDPRHQYAGVTRFKLGFGGAYYQSAGTWDLVIDNKKYKLYDFLRKIRRVF